MSRKRRWRLVPLLAVVVVLIAFAKASTADDWYPGIPPNDGTVDDTWYNSAAGGLGYSNLAKQWFRTPAQMATTRTKVYPFGPLIPDGNGNEVASFHVMGKALIVSPPGAPANYGYMAPVTVRSVGFGMMPVEATMQISQRFKDGYPIPIQADLYADWVNNPAHPKGLAAEVMKPAVVEDAFNVRILKVKIDGVDVGLNGDCRTVTPAPVHLVGPAYRIDDPLRYDGYENDWYATHDPRTFFNPFHGGFMKGTIDIPAFTGCTTRTGGDISGLMTKSASGPGNPIQAVSGVPLCYNMIDGAQWPVAPAHNTPKKANCPDGVMTLPYPDRGSN